MESLLIFVWSVGVVCCRRNVERQGVDAGPSRRTRRNDCWDGEWVIVLKRAFVQDAASVNLGLLPDLSCFCTSCDIQQRQRLVDAVGGYGGSEDLSCKHQIYRPFAHFDPHGTKDASSVKSSR